MSQRNSGYERKERDTYFTPGWVTMALLPHIPDYVEWIWEPAAGNGEMAGVLMWPGYAVHQSDIHPSANLDEVRDFLGYGFPDCQIDAIITNPPYDKAQAFIEHSLDLLKINNNFGTVAMLLRVDFDSAKTRRHLFADNPAWSKKIILTDRIRWFDGGASPSFNHAWYVWDHCHEGPATISYAGKDQSQ